jgi:hypothetical protein
VAHATMSRACVRCLRLKWRRPTSFPSWAFLRTPAVTGALDHRGGSRDNRRRADLGPRSDDAPRRESPSRRPGCLSPPRHAKDSMYAEGLLPPAFAPALPLTPPTLAPRYRDSALDGHCEVTVRSPAWSVTGSRVQTPLLPAGIPRLGLTTQARQQARPTQPSTRTDCLARTGASRSA